MAKVGRKKWIPTESILKEVEAYAARFLQEKQICSLLGVSQDTFIQRKKEFPELIESIQRGRAKVAVNISNKLYEVAMKGNPNVLTFLGKSVVGLRENDPTVIAVPMQTLKVVVKNKEYSIGPDSSSSETR